jgi:hypothetical protein
MSTNYSATSPYYLTGYSQFFLDVMVNRPIPKSVDDILFTINTTFQYRPDLLAFDLYGDATLWWVFTQRNMDVLQDPILDFVPGTKIYIPKNSSLRNVLGL